MQLDAVITASYAVTLAAPWVVLASLRRVRRGDHLAHRQIQSVLLVVGWIAVLALELRIRFAGGSGALIARAAEPRQVGGERLLTLHITFAVATYLLWTWLALVSRRRHGAALPGPFSRRHRRLGLLVLGGLGFTAASATAIYALLFLG